MDKNNKCISLPPWLLVNQGGDPFSTVEAAYHWSLTGGGMTVKDYAKEWSWSVFNATLFCDQLKHWHDNCLTISTIVGVGINNKNSFNNTETTATKEQQNKTITINNCEYPVEDSLCPELYEKIQSSEDGRELIGYWLELYTGAGYQVQTIDSKTIGVAKRLAATANIAMAYDVLGWAFDSDHYRARWLRKQGMMFLFNLCNKQTLVTNHGFYMSTLNRKAKKSSSPALPAEPRYDEYGYLIEGGE